MEAKKATTIQHCLRNRKGSNFTIKVICIIIMYSRLHLLTWIIIVVESLPFGMFAERINTAKSFSSTMSPTDNDKATHSSIDFVLMLHSQLVLFKKSRRFIGVKKTCVFSTAMRLPPQEAK